MSAEYQSFSMHDWECEGGLLLAKLDYLVEMLELEVTNERGQAIVITLQEKEDHFTERLEIEAAEAFAERSWSGNS